MVTILKEARIPGVEVVPCRLNGPRGIVKTFLAYDDDSLVLIDAGFNDADADQIVQHVEKIGRSIADLSACIITHRHSDHTGALKKLRSLTGFTLISHEAEADGVLQTGGVSVDWTVRDGDVLPEAGGIQVVHMPGHTPGSIALYLRQSRALAVGDAIVSAGEHLIVSPPFLSDDPTQARESVRRLLASGLSIDHVLVAHGDDVYGDPASPFSRILLEQRFQ